MAHKILLVDDSITIQKVVSLTFSGSDYDVVAFGSGTEALNKIEEVNPDLILLDVIMPDIKGYEVCEQIKQNPRFKDVPVLLLTGTFEAFDENEADRVGASGYITKPFDHQVVIERVKDLLEQSKAVQPEGTAPPDEVIAEPAAEEKLEEGQDEFVFSEESLFEEKGEISGDETVMFGTDDGPPDIPAPAMDETVIFSNVEGDAGGDLPEDVQDDIFGEDEDQPEDTADILEGEEEEEPVFGEIDELPGESQETLKPEESDPEFSTDDMVFDMEGDDGADTDVSSEVSPSEPGEEDVSFDESEIGQEMEKEDDMLAVDESDEAPVSGQESAEEPVFDDASETEEMSESEPETELAEEFIPETETESEDEDITFDDSPVDSEDEPLLDETPEEPETAEETVQEESDEPEPAIEQETLEEKSEDQIPVPPIQQPVPTTAAGAQISLETSEELVENVSKRVAELLMDNLADKILEKIQMNLPKKAEGLVEKIAWEVVPDLAEILIKKEIDTIKSKTAIN